jgi:D-alanyl-D-alanine carboxypeptidase
MRTSRHPVAAIGFALALLAGSAGVTPAPARAAGPAVAITAPASGTTVVAGPAFRLGWVESGAAGAPIVGRTVEQWSGPVTENWTCPRATFALDWTHDSAIPPVALSLAELGDGICYYWTVTVRDVKGATAKARSGYVLGPPALDPRLAVTFPLRGASAIAAPGGFIVTWSETSSDGVASRGVAEFVTGVSEDGTCDALGWTAGRLFRTDEPLLVVGAPEDRTCHRFTVTIRDFEGRVAQARSGPVLVSIDPPACAYGEVLTSAQDPDDWALTLLDTTYRLPTDSIPPDLRRTTGIALMNGTLQIREVAYPDLKALADAARAAGVPIDLTSAYRSYAQQRTTYAFYVDRLGEVAGLLHAAKPGHSEHQLGTAIDVKADGGKSPESYADWATTKTGAWLRDNAWRYGWVMSYPKGVSPAVTCYQYEPWHYRYVGRDVAKAVHDAGLTLREYLWRAGAIDPGA